MQITAAIGANTGRDSVSSSFARYQAATAAMAVCRIGQARPRRRSCAVLRLSVC